MATKKIKVKVETEAPRWWVVVEPADEEFSNPTKEFDVDVQEGAKHAIAYYCQGGSKKTTLKITATSGDKELAKIDRPIPAKKLTFGHRSFTP